MSGGRGSGMGGMSGREGRLRLLRVRARAWAQIMRAGIRTATPVTAGPRAGGQENAVPTTASHRHGNPTPIHKV